MKQLVSALLVLLLAFMPPLQAAAARNEDQAFRLDTAVDEVQSKLEIPPHYTQFSSNLLLNQQDGRLYLTWSGDPAGDQPGGSVTAGLNERNQIVEVSRYEYGSYTGNYKLSAMDSAQAQALAIEYIRQIRPDLAGQVKALPQGTVCLRNNQQYQLIFYRYHAGIPYYNNYIVVSIGAHNGQLVQLSVTWDETADISSETPSISQQQAQQLFSEQIGLFPSYQRRTDGTVILQYATGLTGDQYINAYTGNVLDTGSQRRAADYAKLGPAPLELTLAQQVEGYPSSERVERILRNLTDLNIPRSFEVTQCQYYVDGPGNPYAQLWFAEGGSQKVLISATIRLDTQELIHFKRSPSTATLTKGRSWDECLRIAKGIVRRHGGKRYEQTAPATGLLQGNLTDEPVYAFHFSPVLQGIPFDGAGITIWIDPASGEMCLFQSQRLPGAELPDPEGMLTVDRAYALLLEQVPFELQYVTLSGSGRTELRLAYGFRPGFPLFVDAFSGQLTYPDGSGYQNIAALTCDDISGHPQQPYIETLLRSQTIPYSPNFRPEEPITKGEFIQWAQNAIGTAGQDTAAVLTDVPEDGFLTNEQATELVVTLLGYGAAAQLPDTYQTGLMDEGAITPGKEGYAAIAKGLGIIRGNAFVPNRLVTRGLAAELLYYCIASDE